MDDFDSLLDALLEDPVPEEPVPEEAPPPPPPPPPEITYIEDTKTTVPIEWQVRRRFGGYVPYEKPVPVLMIPWATPRTFAAEQRMAHDSMDRIRLRAAEKRDTKIKRNKASNKA